jgi:hypothetical protein
MWSNPGMAMRTIIHYAPPLVGNVDASLLDRGRVIRKPYLRQVVAVFCGVAAAQQTGLQEEIVYPAA